MDFTFSEDQLLFQQSARDFLGKEVTPEYIRSLWLTESGRSADLWQKLAELGLPAMTVPEAFGGLGMSELDFVLQAQECGYAALPEPLVNCVMVAVPLLKALGGTLAAGWLPKIAAGEAKVVAGLSHNLLAEDAHVADLLLWEQGGAIYALTPEQYRLQRNESVDPSRRLFAVEIKPGVNPVAEGELASSLIDATLNRGALACAAQALGLAQRIIDISVAYTADRHQFGVPIGSFQAVKHLLANVAVKLEYAKAPVYRAAYRLTQHSGDAMATSHAKLAACEAAVIAGQNGLQVHGAMGYTWEVDLHIFMKKAWVLANTWGDTGFHKNRVAEAIFADGAKIGPGTTFD